MNKMRKRMLVFLAFFVVLLVAVIGRIVYWQIFRGPELKTRGESQQMSRTNVNANRGTIYDRNGKALAESASVNTVICNPQQLKSDDAAEIVSKYLSDILGLEYDEVYRKATKSNKYQSIKKRISVEETVEIEKIKNGDLGDDLKEKFKGVYFETDSKRYYSFSIAPHVIGFTGYDNNGLQGIEKTFDDALTGRAGGVFAARSASGLEMDYQYEEETRASKGADVVLTIDETIQHYLEKYLEAAIKECALKEGAAGIIMNPKTGEILAMVTKPDFNLNSPNNVEQFINQAYGLDQQEDFVGYDSADDEEAREKAITAIRNKMWRNKAISDTYEPGSTFKILTAAMALEENVVSLDTPFYCPGYKQIADRKIRCHKVEGHGAESFLQGVQNSCNPVFMETAAKVGPDKFMDYFKAFGLTQKTNIELIGESGSIFYQHRLSETDLATSAFGQGFSITPIQLITAISSVINGGNLMKPQIVKEIRDENGVVKSYQPQVVNKVISEETSKMMREILETVVSNPRGGGKNAYIKGYRIGGKTGTSEKGRNNNKRIASFVGFAPADDPEIICLIMLDEPQVANRYGGTIAAPIAGKVIEETLEYMGVERQYTAEEAVDVTVNVPELRGMPVESAKAETNKYSLSITIKGNGETVLDQLPKPGAAVTQGSTVIAYTEEQQGETLVTVPDVTGLSIEAAKKKLEVAGLNFEIAGAGLTNSSGAYASKQSISPGEQVAAATVISVEFIHKSTD
ncbi:MAG: penicillin-binding transpeptidase domain-containing protein [Clostridia bacterium]|nr:penicillin-binding transpeptidase domain-containing protein [Clostridia bacterium]